MPAPRGDRRSGHERRRGHDRHSGRGRPHGAARRRHGVALLGAAALALAALPGCDNLASAQQAISHADLVNDLATRLSEAESREYTAQYRLAGGAEATVARQLDPPRVAYRYPGGALLVTEDATVECETAATPASCVRGAATPPTANPRARLFRPGGVGGFVPATQVISLLTAAALDPNATISQHDTTIAGAHATCVAAAGVREAAAAEFTACVTTTGVLGSLSGTVRGEPIQVTLVRLTTTVEPAAFEPPAPPR